MSWSEDGSEYGEGGDGEDTGSDIDELPDDELIVVLRDEQNSIKEAQRLIHKEIKSIRRELKRLLWHYASTQADADPRQPQDVTTRDITIDSGLGEANYMTDTTTSEVASSHGDSEAGFQAFMEYDAKEPTAHLEDERRYEQEAEYIQETLKDPGKGHGTIDGLLHQGRTQNGIKSGYGVPLQWGDSDTHPELDLTRGKNSTYEDAYSMMRRRHSQADVTGRKSTTKSSGNRWKSIIQKHGKSIYSIPESDHRHPQKIHKESHLPPQERGSIQSSEDEMGHLQSYPDNSPNTANPDRRLGSPGVQHGQIPQQNRRQIKRTQSEQTLKVHIDAHTKATYMPMIKKAQLSKFHLIPSSRTAVPQERPSSDQDLPLYELDAYDRMQHVISSEDESKHPSRFPDSSYDAYLGHAPQRFDRYASSELPLRSDHYPQVHSMGRNSPKGLKRPQTSPSGSPRTKSQEQDSRQRHTSPKHLFTPKDAFPGGVNVDENWNTESLPENQTALTHLSDEEIHKDYYRNHAAAKYTGRKPQITRRSTLPLMKVQGLVSSVP